MSQDDLYNIIKANPGITQDDAKKLIGTHPSTASQQIKKLEKWRLIRRERTGWTYRLYLRAVA